MQPDPTVAENNALAENLNFAPAADVNLPAPVAAPTPPATPATPAAPVDPMAQVAETLKGLSEAVSGFDSRIGGIETTLTELATSTPGEPTPPAAPATSAFQPKSWDDIPKLVEEKGAEVAKQVIADREKEVKEALVTQEENMKKVDEEFDTMLANLEKEGKLPPIKNQNDPNDVGKFARRELFGFASYLGQVDLNIVADTLNALHTTGQVFDIQAGKIIKPASAPVPGATIPIGSSGGVTAMTPGAPDYKTIHGAKDLHTLVRMSGLYG